MRTIDLVHSKLFWLVLALAGVFGCDSDPGYDESTGTDSDSAMAGPGDSDSSRVFDTATDSDSATETASDSAEVVPEDTGSADEDSDTPSDGIILYDGESVPYASGEPWDDGSSISESSASPHSTPHHIRAEVVTSAGWGAVVYYFDAVQDWTEATRLSMWAQSDQAVNVTLALVYVNGVNYDYGSASTLELTTSYQAFDIDMASISGDVDLTAVAGIILYSGSGRFTVDLDDIVLTTGLSLIDTDSMETDSDSDTVVDMETDSSDTDSEVDTGSDTADTDSAPPELEEVHFFGRFDWREPESPGCAWSNCGAGVRFEGDALDIALSGAGGITFQVVVDGELATEVTTAGGEWSSDPTVRNYRVAEGLGAGPHDVQVYRNPEAMFGVVKFHGFTAENGALIPSPFPFNRRIEIVGDSISAGYGNDGCPFAASTEIGTAAYGPLSARGLGAIAHVQAWSGMGMAMNYDGTSDRVVPDLYDLALPDDVQTTWDFQSYIPDVVLINLGTNDFNGGVNRDDYIQAYEAFVSRVRGHYPDAYILCAVNSFGDAFSDEVDEVITNLDDAFVEKIDLNAPSWTGCDGHPDLTAHQAMADTLTARLRSSLGW